MHYDTLDERFVGTFIQGVAEHLSQKLQRKVTARLTLVEWARELSIYPNALPTPYSNLVINVGVSRQPFGRVYVDVCGLCVPNGKWECALHDPACTPERIATAALLHYNIAKFIVTSDWKIEPGITNLSNVSLNICAIMLNIQCLKMTFKLDPQLVEECIKLYEQLMNT